MAWDQETSQRMEAQARERLHRLGMDEPSKMVIHRVSTDDIYSADAKRREEAMHAMATASIEIRAEDIDPEVFKSLMGPRTFNVGDYVYHRDDPMHFGKVAGWTASHVDEEAPEYEVNWDDGGSTNELAEDLFHVTGPSKDVTAASSVWATVKPPVHGFKHEIQALSNALESMVTENHGKLRWVFSVNPGQANPEKLVMLAMAVRLDACVYHGAGTYELNAAWQFRLSEIHAKAPGY